MSTGNNQNTATENIENLKANPESKNETHDFVSNFRDSADKTVTKMEVNSAVSIDNAESDEDGESLGYSEGEHRKKGDGDIKKSQKAKNDDSAAQIRASIAQGPKEITQKAMTRMVKIAIHKEIKVVQKEIHKLSKDTIGNAFAISEALKRLKKLKFILKNLAHWAADVIKNLFQRVDNGEKLVDAALPQD